MLLHPVPDHEDKKLPVTKTPKKKKKATKKVIVTIMRSRGAGHLRSPLGDHTLGQYVNFPSARRKSRKLARSAPLRLTSSG